MQFNAVYYNSTLKNGNSLQEAFLKYICITFLFCNPNQSSMKSGSPIVTSWQQLAVTLRKIRSYHTSQSKPKSSRIPVLTSYSYIRNHIYLQLFAIENPDFSLQKYNKFYNGPLNSSLGAKMKAWSLSPLFATDLLYLIIISYIIQPTLVFPSLTLVMSREKTPLCPETLLPADTATSRHSEYTKFFSFPYVIFNNTTGSLRGPAIWYGFPFLCY